MSIRGGKLPLTLKEVASYLYATARYYELYRKRFRKARKEKKWQEQYQEQEWDQLEQQPA